MHRQTTQQRLVHIVLEAPLTDLQNNHHMAFPVRIDNYFDPTVTSRFQNPVHVFYRLLLLPLQYCLFRHDMNLLLPYALCNGTRDTEKIQENSQKQDDTQFRERIVRASDQDLGSYELIKDEKELIWYPAEVNTSIRPGWFYHEEEDDQVKSLETLISIYEHSVGGNATFLLNIPPTKEGLFHENDVKRLHEIGEYKKKCYGKNLLEKASLFCEEQKKGFEIENVRNDDYDSYFTTLDGQRNCRIHIKFDKEYDIHRVVLKENIKKSQRIEAFRILTVHDGSEKCIFEGTVVGYKKIALLDEIKTKELIKELVIEIIDSRVAPTLSYIGIFE